ncbi:type I restriction enzyme HsdR N-terminal domain-containing protein [Cellulosimicrobium cellulans]|uniref:type I restriction enzyme HsdR N-terminal domain-containing protein n=1 Tax=Cellulosimicrobium TaxID=157920 RepID=UPI00119D677F|nr:MULTISPECIES: type I restriction enzyme HsdR N-terminal domain-containing protein [Cellulosimicrobium]MBE9937783.1 restriction endonuclease [Cellulosimicrobium cellulans]MBN0042098.1 type I restriction enzyme HsdR N-terminal domain-containing protein [Cellulosimicrobium cellulans]QUB98511.1 type I restriction enzyme HsdR N-terminal domain-containing protein [Cellulosimicrobium cellulans]
MEIGERLASLATKIQQQKATIGTEEATKNAFVMPFISLVLGYDVFNPNEVIPEFTADVGTKKGEKIDYAIVKDGELQMLVEAKTIGSPLSLNHASQLFRYFATTNARIAILTNGQHFHFFTDLDKPNRMDEKPFLQLDLLDLDETLIPEVQKLTKDTFDLESVVSAAEELKYIGALKRALAAQFREPDDEWIKALTNRVYDGSFTQKVKEQFRILVAKAMKQFLADQVNDRLKAALGGQAYPDAGSVPMTGTEAAQESVAEAARPDDRGIETTLDEIEGYQIIRAIACSEVSPARIVHRDTKSYMGVLLDDNNRKPIARLHFNTGQRYLGLFDENKVETRHPITSLDEIYEHAEHVRKTVHNYL